MVFGIYGPFEIPRQSNNKAVDKAGLRSFWREVDKQEYGLPRAVGCYIFAIGAGKGMRPWYVGQTRRGFQLECFQPTKLLHFQDALIKRKKGRPLMYFVAQVTGSGKKFSKPKKNGDKALEFLEKWLIGEALDRNANLLNVKDTKFLRNLEVWGLFNSGQGKPGRAARDVRWLLGR